ncbi:hypothetical protein L1987_88139 [Smallanthus sonchifolius]|nr:hypothetical protein L1987_88139 [Smallanthus sonchifolius]
MGEKEKKEVFIEEALHPRTNADPEEWVWAFEKMNMQRVSPRGRVQEGLCRFLSTWCTSEGRTDSEKEEAWHEIGGGRISDSELLDSMDGGGRKISTHFIHSVPAVRRDPQQTKGESLLCLACCSPIFRLASPEATKGGLGPGRGEWPSGQKRQTVNLLKFFYVGSNPASPTCCRLQRREKRHSSA